MVVLLAVVMAGVFAIVAVSVLVQHRNWQVMLAVMHDLSQNEMLERRELLNRIDPSTAQWAPAEHTMPEVDIPLDDDGEYARLANLSKEQLAELAAARG